MISIISNLPITPKLNPMIGHYFTPFVGDILSKHLDLPYLLYINLTGKQVQAENRKQLLESFTRPLPSLGIDVQIITDYQDSYQQYVADIVTQLYRENIIIKEETKIFRCKCGIVELPLAKMQSNSKYNKLVTVTKDGQVFCRVCNEEANLYTSDSLLLQLPNRIPASLNLIDKQYTNELQDVFYKLVNIRYRISRERTTYFDVILDGEQYFLDVDFAWSLMMNFLYTQGYDVRVLVTSSKTLSAVAKTLLFNDVISGWNIENLSIVVTPFLKYKSENREKYRATYLTNLYEVETLRWWLAETLNWSLKETALDTRRIYWIMQSINKISHAIPKNNNKQGDAASLQQAIQTKTVQQNLLKARKSDDMYEPDGILYHCLLIKSPRHLPKDQKKQLTQFAMVALTVHQEIQAVYTVIGVDYINITVFISQTIDEQLTASIKTLFPNIPVNILNLSQNPISIETVEQLASPASWIHLAGSKILSRTNNLFKQQVLAMIQMLIEEKTITPKIRPADLLQIIWQVVHLMLFMVDNLHNTYNSNFVAFQVNFGLSNNDLSRCFRTCLNWVTNPTQFQNELNQHSPDWCYRYMLPLWNDLMLNLESFQISDKKRNN